MCLSEESWKPIPSVPGLEASSFGRIRVIPYQGKMPYGGFRTYGGTPTCGQWVEKEQRYIYNRGGKDRTYRVARLVCESFNGPASFPNAVVMHDDENPRNNVPTNLIWGTQKQNLNYPGFLEYCSSRTGDKNPRVKGKKKENNEKTTEPVVPGKVPKTNS